MKSSLAALAFIALSSGSVLAFQDEHPAEEPTPEIKPLTIGDPARPIDISDWVKGDKVAEFQNDHVYVVEFWATWCPPCRDSMPHLSKLQDQYKDYKVSIIGVSDEPLETVTKFLAGSEKMKKAQKDAGKIWNDLVAYTLTTDPDESVKNDYFAAAGQRGIPCAFIIGKDQHVEWIGHPMGIDEPLEKVVKGTWDRAAFKTKWEEEQAAEAKGAAAQNDPEMQQAMTDYQAAMTAKDWNKAAAVLDSVAAKHPEMANGVNFAKFNMFLTQANDSKAAAAAAQDLIKANNEDAMTLNQIAWMMANGPEDCRDNSVALAAASRANELSKGQEAAILDTLALCCFNTGDLESAINHQKAAVALAPDDEMGADIAANLKKYEEAFAAKKN